MKKRTLVLAIVATVWVLVPSLAARAQPPSAATGITDTATVIYDNVELFDGTGTPFQASMAIVVRGSRIEAVVPSTSLTAQDRSAAEVVDASGLFAIPGLIESHTHLATTADREMAQLLLNRYLYAGITTVRDMAGDIRSLMDLQRASLIDEIDAPNIVYAALVAGPSFFADPRTKSSAMGETAGEVPWMQAVVDTTDLRELITLARGTFASGLKTYAAIDGLLLARIAGEARYQGMPVWSHTHVGPARPLEVAMAGVTTMSHICSFAAAAIPQDVFEDGQAGRRSGFVDVDIESPAIDKVFQVMKEKGTVLDATVRVYVAMERQQASSPSRPPPPAAESADSTAVGEIDLRRRGVRATCTAADAVNLTRRAFEAGVIVSAGTDGMADPDDEWPALYEEMIILNDRVGLPMEEVIVAATRNGSIALGLEDEIGTVTPGKLANVVFLREDPLSGAANLRFIEFTLKRGTRYNRADFVLGSPPERYR